MAEPYGESKQSNDMPAISMKHFFARQTAGPSGHFFAKNNASFTILGTLINNRIVFIRKIYQCEIPNAIIFKKNRIVNVFTKFENPKYNHYHSVAWRLHTRSAQRILESSLFTSVVVSTLHCCYTILYYVMLLGAREGKIGARLPYMVGCRTFYPFISISCHTHSKKDLELVYFLEIKNLLV